MRPIIQKYNPVITPNANDAHSCFLRTMSTTQERNNKNCKASSREFDVSREGGHDAMVIKPSTVFGRRDRSAATPTALGQGECGRRSLNSCHPVNEAMNIPKVIHRPAARLIRSHLTHGPCVPDSSIVGHFDCPLTGEALTPDRGPKTGG